MFDKTYIKKKGNYKAQITESIMSKLTYQYAHQYISLSY